MRDLQPAGPSHTVAPAHADQTQREDDHLEPSGEGAAPAENLLQSGVAAGRTGRPWLDALYAGALQHVRVPARACMHGKQPFVSLTPPVMG